MTRRDLLGYLLASSAFAVAAKWAEASPVQAKETPLGKGEVFFSKPSGPYKFRSNKPCDPGLLNIQSLENELANLRAQKDMGGIIPHEGRWPV